MAIDDTTIPAFFEAVDRGDERGVANLLDMQPSLIRQRSADGGTALHVAAWEGHLGLIDLLLGRGADLDARDDRHGMLPIAWANEHGHMAVVRDLAGRGALVPFQLLAAFGLLDRLARALDADPQQIDEQRGFGTALHFAALWGQPEAVQMLLAAGANTELPNEDGERAITVAKRQTDGNARDTMLVTASRKSEIQEGCTRVVAILLEHGSAL